MQTDESIKKIESPPLFFILGRPRSGTTLLASLFDAHPNVVLPFECPLIINIYTKYAKIKNWNKKILLNFYYDIVNQRKFDTWMIDLEKLKNDILMCEGENSFETLIKVVYSNFNSFFDKKEIKLIGDKNPVYSIYPEQLVKLFPNAKFIHLTRDYRDNILSIKKVDFEAPITSLLAYRWKFATKRILKVIKKNPNSFHTVKYEDLVVDPPKVLTEMCKFLGVEFEESVLNFHKKKEELFKLYDRTHIEKYHSSLLRPISSDKIYGWKKSISDKELKIADSVVGKYAELSGYSRKYKKVNLVVKLRSFVWITYGKFAYWQRFMVDALPFKMKMWSRNKGPLLAVIYNKLLG
ncbi:MAG: sulfotransferase [Bacteroidetes bacterium]|jgi:hypothetical protein|nr:sulfotransferase [Bacteroidota bacterium]MBT6686691.1 sulfotransferase [Bacteroidota bacterium]MBT7141829.1 sulfotransferase [Bacteroidota bacterium]MBT7490680.1 sulfotransferase [Bacteroidota bacterium]